MRSICALSAAAVLLLALSACATDDELPRSRLGALPFPGAFTLYEASGVSELGPHRYAPWLERPFERSEGARGIMYTCRAGFLDLAHVREAVDWTRYAWRQTRTLFQAGGGSHSFEHEDTRFVITVTLPPWWSDLAPPERDAMIDEAALRGAQRIAYDVQTWHEIATWCGWRTLPMISEAGSAFTCDDTSSHLVGVLIAGRLLREGDADFDRRAAAELRRGLDELGAVSSAMVDRAARAVEDVWWRDGVAVRRDLDTGVEDGFKVPWLVPDLECCAGCEPAVLAVPSLKSVNGRDLSAACELRIAPPSWLLERLRPGEPRTAQGFNSRELLSLIEIVRAQMAARWGPEFDRPAAPTRTTHLPAPPLAHHGGS